MSKQCGPGSSSLQITNGARSDQEYLQISAGIEHVISTTRNILA